MIHSKEGVHFHYNGVTYTVGDHITANQETIYSGLFGTIKDIQFGTKEKASNGLPAIHCSFIPPFVPREISELEIFLSENQSEKKKLEELNLGDIILSPRDIQLMNPGGESRKLTIFVTRAEKYVNGIKDIQFACALSEDEAQRHLAEIVNEEKRNGCIRQWAEHPGFKAEITPLYYECWLDNDFPSNHLEAGVYREELHMTYPLLQSIGRLYIETLYLDHQMAKPE